MTTAGQCKNTADQDRPTAQFHSGTVADADNVRNGWKRTLEAYEK